MKTVPSGHPVLSMSAVSKDFKFGSFIKRSVHQAVKSVDLTLQGREILGLVGESGSGKSTVGRMAIGLARPTSGKVTVLGDDLSLLSKTEMRLKRRTMQMIFQDSSNSLNPRMSLNELLCEPLRVQGLYTPEERGKRAASLADEVQLARKWLERRPHEFSGGQRQRISIARALALEPELIVADEPVSALDVSVQATVLNLLKDIQEERKLSMVFISHDMAVVEFMSDNVAVLYNGSVVEYGPAHALFANPQNEYTKVLLASTPSL